MGCTVADDYVSRTEFNYRFDGLEKRLDGVDKRLDQKVPLDTWNLQNSHVAGHLAELDRDSRERDDDIERATDARFKRIEDRGQNAWVRVLGVLGIAATLIAAVWAAYLSSRGAH